MNYLVFVVLRIVLVASIMAHLLVSQTLHPEQDSSNCCPALQIPLATKSFLHCVLVNNMRLRTLSAIDNETNGQHRETDVIFHHKAT
jgi:hypothetical protein